MTPLPPPIANPHVHEEKLPPKPPFRGLKIFVGVNALDTLLYCLKEIYTSSSWVVTAIFVLFYALWGLLLWRLWHGSKAAREIFWWISMVSIPAFLFTLQEVENSSSWVRWLDYASHGLTIFGLVWLQLPGVKAHFRREQSS